MRYNKKRLSILLAAVLALMITVGGAVGGTMAWLVDNSDQVVNTFTTSDITVTLTETGADNNSKSFKMIPGHTIVKDPIVTVEGGSEDCYVFIKVEKSANLDEFITYAIDEKDPISQNGNWTKLPGVDGVYYCVATDIDKDRSIKVILNNQVTVKDSVTKEMMNALTPETQPFLSFTAYACQYWQSNDTAFKPEDAWKAITDDNSNSGAAVPGGDPVADPFR